MENKNEYNLTPYIEDLTEIVIDLILNHYDKVGIIAMYGSRARGDYVDTSDLEFFAVLEEETEDKIGFLFHGITVDIGTHTWKGIKNIADRDGYWVVPAGTIATAKIVYARTEEDKDRYESIRSEIIEKHNDAKLIHPEAAEEVYQNMVKKLGHLNLAKLHNDLNEAHGCVWGLIIGYTIAMANLNGRHLINNWGKSLDEVFQFPNQPEGVEEIIDQIILETDIDQIISLGADLVNKVREFLITYNEEPDEEPQLEMLNSVNGLEYLYKIEKASRQDHIPALAYAIQDSQPLFAKDIVKIHGNWKNFSHLLFYSEYARNYHQQGTPDLLRSMLKGDKQELLHGIKETRIKIQGIIMDATNLPNFHNLSDIKPYFDNSEE